MRVSIKRLRRRKHKIWRRRWWSSQLLLASLLDSPIQSDTFLLLLLPCRYLIDYWKYIKLYSGLYAEYSAVWTWERERERERERIRNRQSTWISHTYSYYVSVAFIYTPMSSLFTATLVSTRVSHRQICANVFPQQHVLCVVRVLNSGKFNQTRVCPHSAVCLLCCVICSANKKFRIRDIKFRYWFCSCNEKTNIFSSSFARNS